MDKQTALDQYRDIFVATIDFLLEMGAARVIVDNDDVSGRNYEKLKQQAANHYRNGDLERLQQLIRRKSELSILIQHEAYITFMKERTGYDAAILQQMAVELPAPKRGEVVIKEDGFIHKELIVQYAPDHKRKVVVYEFAYLPGEVITEVNIHFGRAGASVYTVKGAGLDIAVSWKDNNIIVIETRKEYVAMSRHGKQYQSGNDIVYVEYVVR